ncbi:MAG: HlyU family transcriptional regulator [Geminicoccaceae bacterium]
MVFGKLFGGLFGGGEPAGASASDGSTEHYQGLNITARPQAESGQWRVGGVIWRGEGEQRQEVTFVRADLFPSRDEADRFSIEKGRKIINERGERVFEHKNA